MELGAVRELPRKDIVTEWWSEVNEKFWDDARPQMQRLLKALMEHTLVEELERVRRRDVAVDARLVSRNGYYRRSLITHVGTLHDLRVPRLRYGRFQTQVFRRYRRCERLIEDLIREVFLSGRLHAPCGRGGLRPAGDPAVLQHRLPDHPQLGSPGARVPSASAAG